MEAWNGKARQGVWMSHPKDWEIEQPVNRRHNLPMEYVESIPELYSLIYSMPYNYLFRREFASLLPVTFRLPVNSQCGWGEGSFNHAIRYGGYCPFTRWSVLVLRSVTVIADFDGFGSSPLAALEDAVFRRGMKKVGEMEITL